MADGVDAMVLAAGLGTRLRPLTDRVPKALVPVGGRPMLERVLERLVEAGADRIIVNTHWMADQVERFLEGWIRPGVEVRLSPEQPEILETGGGLLHARGHFRGDAPFLLHNVDVISRVDLRDLYARHLEGRPLATLAVNRRETSRALLFDDGGLVGHELPDGRRRLARAPRGAVWPAGFCGIHVMEPDVFDHIEEEGRFSIVTTWMRWVEEGVALEPYDIGDTLWVDVGTPDRLERARQIAEADEAVR